MEIPYELKHLRYQLNKDFLSANYFILFESSSLCYLTIRQKFILAEIINQLGQFSNQERQLFFPVTAFHSFISSKGKKILLLKCIGDIIIGFIYFKENFFFC